MASYFKIMCYLPPHPPELSLYHTAGFVPSVFGSFLGFPCYYLFMQSKLSPKFAVLKHLLSLSSHGSEMWAQLSLAVLV